MSPVLVTGQTLLSTSFSIKNSCHPSPLPLPRLFRGDKVGLRPKGPEITSVTENVLPMPELPRHVRAGRFGWADFVSGTEKCGFANAELERSFCETAPKVLVSATSQPEWAAPRAEVRRKETPTQVPGRRARHSGHVAASAAGARPWSGSTLCVNTILPQPGAADPHFHREGPQGLRGSSRNTQMVLGGAGLQVQSLEPGPLPDLLPFHCHGGAPKLGTENNSTDPFKVGHLVSLPAKVTF